MAEQIVTLVPGESRTISFEVMPEVAKTYHVSIDSLTGTFKATEVAVTGRIGKWHYAVTVAYPTVHREKGDWLDHTLDFDFDFKPSTWFMSLYCYNDSPSEVMAELKIVASNAHIVHQPSPAFNNPLIKGNSRKHFSWVMTLPRTPGDYYFDAVLSFDGVVVDEGRWIIRYY